MKEKKIPIAMSREYSQILHIKNVCSTGKCTGDTLRTTTHLHALGHVLGPVRLLARVAAVAGVPAAEVEGLLPAHYTLGRQQT